MDLTLCLVGCYLIPVALLWGLYFYTKGETMFDPNKARTLLQSKRGTGGAGTETISRDELLGCGFSLKELEACERFIQANGIDWRTMLQYLVQYGPQILQFILSLTGGGGAPVTS